MIPIFFVTALAVSPSPEPSALQTVPSLQQSPDNERLLDPLLGAAVVDAFDFEVEGVREGSAPEEGGQGGAWAGEESGEQATGNEAPAELVPLSLLYRFLEQSFAALNSSVARIGDWTRAPMSQRARERPRACAARLSTRPHTSHA